MAESSVAISGIEPTSRIRNLLVTTLVNNVPTPVLMQVVSIANESGKLIDLDSGSRLDTLIAISLDVRRELLIQNELLIQGLGLDIDLEKEYRNDPEYNDL